MRASALEFRLRYLLHFIVFALGFWSPWNAAFPLGSQLSIRQSTWLALAAIPARNGLLGFSASTVTVLLLGILCAALAAFLRTWGSAYLGASIVKDGAMHATMVADGPYRHLRNPLYLGTWLHTLALALLMPPTGAVFTVIVIGRHAGPPGRRRRTLPHRIGRPRLHRLPRPLFHASCPPSRPASQAPGPPLAGPRPASESSTSSPSPCPSPSSAGVTNAMLLTQCTLVSFGLSLVARALLPPVTITNERPAQKTRRLAPSS